MKKYLVIAGMLCSSVAFGANGDSYFGAGYHMGSYDEDGFPSANPSAIKVEYGKYLTDVIAVEGHFALGLGDDSVTYQGTQIDLELKQALSLFLKGDLNLTDSVNLYGLLGLTKGKLKAAIPAFNQSLTEDDSGLSYGFGIESSLANGLAFSAEYIMYLSEDDYDYSGINIGIAKKF